jgi:hypothetical protein
MATTSPPTRFVALDIHRKYLVVGAVDPHQQVVLTPRRFGWQSRLLYLLLLAQRWGTGLLQVHLEPVYQPIF